MSELNEKLLEIKRQKDTYILPENLKKDVEVFGITGTYAGSGGGSGDVKLFDTVEHMQQDPSPSEGDLAVVYRSELEGITEDSEFSSCIFPNTVVLDEAFTGSINGGFGATDQGVVFAATIEVSSSRFRFSDYVKSGEIIAQYTSQDGITYTRTDGGEELQEFGTTIKWESFFGPFNSIIGNFMKIGGSTFEGLYEYKSNKYILADNQLDATLDYVYEKTFYGKNGVENGTLTNSVSNSFTDVSAEVFSKIQARYDALTPRVLTDNDKNIDTGIFIIPAKSNGTPLLDTSNVTGMYGMFAYCRSLTSIPLLDTSGVTYMYGMFNSCSNLTSIPLLNTSNVTNMGSMFDNCSNLTSIPLLDTSNVTGMGSMFAYCKSLTSIPLLNTSNVTDMYGMFNSCSSLNNESLNNILAMCANAVKITSNKTLKYIGLTEEQANICKTLSNYQDFVNAGWTTGY